MKQRKVWIFLLIILVIGIIVGGIFLHKKRNKNKEDQNPGETCFDAGVGMTLNEQYAFFHKQVGNQLQLQIFDVNTKTVKPFCFDPGCEHLAAVRNYDGEILKEGCNSFEISDSAVFMKEEGLYYLASDGSLYVSDHEGRNRKLITKLPDEYMLFYQELVFTDNYLFLFMFNDYELAEALDEDGNTFITIGAMKDTRDCLLVRVSLKDGERKEIFKNEAYTGSFGYELYGNKLRFSYFYMDIPLNQSESLSYEEKQRKYQGHRLTDIMEYDVSKDEFRVIMEHVSEVSIGFLQNVFVIGHQDSQKYEVMSYDGEKIYDLSFTPYRMITKQYGITEGTVYNLTGGKYVLVDDNTGSITRQTTIPENISPIAIMGNTFYCWYYPPDGMGGSPAYLSMEDFWKGDVSRLFLLYEPEKQGNSLPMVTQSGEGPITVTPSPVGQKEEWENAAHTVTWLYTFFHNISPEAQKEINRRLFAKGLDCKINFINAEYAVDQEYIDWLSDYESDDEHEPIDILYCGNWNNADRSSAFAKGHLLSLDEFMSTEIGEELKNSYGQAEWSKVSVDGHVFTIPKSESDFYNNGVYMVVGQEYNSFFENFDGTYESLRKIYAEINNPELKIVIDYLDVDSIIGFLGWECTYNDIPFDKNTKKTVDISSNDRLLPLMDLLYKDLESHVLVDLDVEGKSPADVLAYIYYGRRPVEEGYTEYEILAASYWRNLSATTGINKDSRQKELALQVLCACYTDPAIASLINWGIADEKKWKEKQKLMLAEECNELSGYAPNLTDEQIGFLREYRNILSRGMESTVLKYSEQTGKRQLNPHYEDVIKQLQADSKKYEGVLAALDKEMEKLK